MTIRQAWPLLPALALLLLTPSCGEGNPVAPTGTVLTVTASPTTIDLNGFSVITVTGRKPDGNPLAANTEIRFSTTLGSLSSFASVGENGVARNTLTADGRFGDATVTVTTGDGSATAEIVVQIGESDSTKLQIATLIASPNEINIDDNETSTISAVVRNPDGSAAAADLEVSFFTTLGIIDDSALTDSSGTARARLRTGDEPGQAEITAFVGSSDPATTNVTITRDAASRIVLQATPTSVDRSSPANIELTAIVNDDKGDPFNGALVTFDPEAGSLNQTGQIETNSRGEARVILLLDQEDLPAAPTNSFVVTASVAGASGQTISDSVTIRITDGGGG